MIKLTLIQGDCLKILPTLKDESVDLVLTDPPYNILDKKEWDSFKNIHEYKNFSLSYLKEFERIMKNGASCFIFWSEKHIFLFDEILKQINLKLFKILIWHYPNILKGFSNKRWHNTFDFIFHLVKGDKPKIFNASFVREENKDVWTFTKPQYNFKKNHKYHPTQKPYELISRIVKMFSLENNVILDPFLGSGTTMKVARDLKRNCIGIEINPKYIEITKKRLNWGSSLGNIEFEFFTEEEFKKRGVI
ncbi:MAG: site-specific DNA-methyltransferase [Candidatus Aenigmatarchaeota archaeon]